MLMKLTINTTHFFKADSALSPEENMDHDLAQMLLLSLLFILVYGTFLAELAMSTRCC